MSDVGQEQLLFDVFQGKKHPWIYGIMGDGIT